MPLKIPNTSPSSSADFRDSPLEYVRVLFVSFFQGLFESAPSGAYHWDEDESLSEIYISDESSLKGSTIGQRPAITCTRGPVQFYSLGLDDMSETDVRTGMKQKAVLVPGTMTLNCSSRMELESERIAWVCAEHLWLCRELLMKEGFFEIGRMPAIGAPSSAGSIIVADSGDEWVTTSVTCPFQFQRTSQVTPLNKRIAGDIRVRARAHMVSVREQYETVGGHGGAPATPMAEPPFGVLHSRPPAFAPAASDVYGGTPVAGDRAPILQVVPHPRNPAQLVTIRSSRPNAPAVRPPGMGGRPIPIAAPHVKDSCSNQGDTHVTGTHRFKV